MESAAIDISLTLLLSTNQESLFANSKSSKWMFMKCLIKYTEVVLF
jgi:hypothetical protein